MSDFISGIKNVPPTYPVKPVQPASKDRKSDKRKKDRPKPDSGNPSHDDVDDRYDGDNPEIDEYV